MELIDGKKIAAEIKQELADEVSRMKAEGKKRLIWSLCWSATTAQAKHMWQVK